MTNKKISMRNAVNRMDEATEKAFNGTLSPDIAKTATGEVNAIIRLLGLQISAAHTSGQPVKLPTMDFIDLS